MSAREIAPDSEDRQRVTVYLTAVDVRWLDATRDLLGRDRSATMRDLIAKYGPELTVRYSAAASQLLDE